MTALETAPKRELFDHIFKVSLDRTCCELLDDVANGAHDGNRSAAVRHLIRVHAGLEAERVDDDPEVDAWKTRSLNIGLTKEVAGLIRGGCVRADALRIAGVTKSQADEWDKRGRADARALKVTVFSTWLMTLERAEAEYKRQEIRGVSDSKWKLERSYPAEYGKRSTSDATVTHRTVPMIDFERLTLAEARALVELLRKASPGADEIPGGRGRPIGELLPADLDGEAVEVPDA